ncbi:Anthranilate phosphoribosyltransferase [Propionispora sp. 2/2-37]|uniref:anthranilate phosphoribosyltransferase n=1 Tax=Propionispora sp. 2/2-37 TaxID=1677858 RepID=UPI0006BB5DE9|nr:anthranilate phosphoribosyltransferase [Propionispora sp. 2/2-37]CUH96980.1 Anthranilate phosphoribosyltransferase [Propionispora sp. 2/2-37]
MLKKFLAIVVNKTDLTREEAKESMDIIMSGKASEGQIGAFLAALRVKGEVVEEITGFAETMRAHAEKISCKNHGLIDTCGTGGDSKGTFNISTTAAFVLAGAGVSVAKHGNRGATSPCGSADLLEALGVRITLAPEIVAQSIDKIGIGFMYAPAFHGAMKYAAKPRRDLGFRTVFNILGPLTNPAGAECQLMGIYDGRMTTTIAETLAALGSKRAMVVHSHDGMDEISTAVPTTISEVKGGDVHTYQIDPEKLGFVKPPREAYLGGSALENAKITLDILQGQKGFKRDIVLLNAAAGLIVSGKAESFPEGLELAASSIDCGAALAKLEELKKFSVVHER